MTRGLLRWTRISMNYCFKMSFEEKVLKMTFLPLCSQELSELRITFISGVRLTHGFRR